jgi:hypothetical protein
MKSTRSDSDQTSAAYFWNIAVSETVNMIELYGNAVINIHADGCHPDAVSGD